jgi:hypothetical protein
MACCRAGPALSTQPQQRAHERRVSGVSIRLGMRAAPAVRQWPAGRLVGGGGGSACGESAAGARGAHITCSSRACHITCASRARITCGVRRAAVAGGTPGEGAAAIARGSGAARGCGGGVCARGGRSACERSAASKGSQWRGFGRARAALTLAAQSPVATGRVPCPRNPVLEAARVSSAPVRVFLQTSEIP